MPRDFILLPDAAVQCWAFWTLGGLERGKAEWNDAAVIHVTDAPVSKSHENVFPLPRQ